MVIKGTDFNAVRPLTAALQKKPLSAGAAGSIFARRFDTLELSDIFKKYSDTGDVKSQAEKMRRMLSKTESPADTERYTNGLASYAYMEISLAGEAIRTECAIYKFSSCSEQKEYYQGLLDKADGISAEKTSAYEEGSIYEQINRENEKIIRENRIRNGYEYVENEDGTFDRDKVESALANIQKRIDSVIEDTKNQKNRVDLKTFKKCAAAFADAFETDSDELTLSEKDFDKMFGVPDVNEENFLEKMKEKSESLWKGYNCVNKHFESCLDKIRKTSSNGKERVANLRNALTESYGKSFNDLLTLLSELWKNDEKA